MSLTLAGVSAATIMLTITKLQLIIVNTARLKPKWQNNVNAFFGYLILRTGETKRLLRFIPGAGSGERTTWDRKADRPNRRERVNLQLVRLGVAYPELPLRTKTSSAASMFVTDSVKVGPIFGENAARSFGKFQILFCFRVCDQLRSVLFVSGQAFESD